MTEGLGMLTLAIRLELSSRMESPERILTSVMLRPESLLRPGVCLASWNELS